MKKIYSILLPFLLGLVLISVSCNKKEKEKSFIKKVALKSETIAVGIYKATGFEYPEHQYIAEALNIDGGVVYVTLSDEDVLKTKLENIDVVIFPAMNKGQNIETLDDQIAEIFKKFTATKGKGVVGICNGGCFISSTPDCLSIDLMNIHVKNNPNGELQSGLVRFELTEFGESIFPELVSYADNLLIKLYNATEIDIVDDSETPINLIGKRDANGSSYPMLVSSTYGDGKILITNIHPETTPGMRWMIPRIVRWVFNKPFISYGKNVFRPDLFSNEIVLTPEIEGKIDSLTSILETGNKNDKLSAIDQLQDVYPWAGLEKITTLLNDKNDDIKMRAAKYLVDNEYTYALNDLMHAIKKERSRKVRDKLTEYKTAFENMLEQN